MKITVLYNRDYDPGSPQGSDPGHAARAEIEGVAAAVAAALSQRPGVEARTLPAFGHAFRFVGRLIDDPPDLVFNLCESLAGDARGELAIPAILDTLGVPYTGSPAVALALALHKHKAKEVLRGHGVPTPAGAVIRRLEELEGLELPFPLMIKPAREDASVGISRNSVVHDREALLRQVAHVLAVHKQEVLVEQYVEGREIYVALMGGGEQAQVLPLTEIDFSRMPDDRPRIVTYDAKWEEDSVEWAGTTPFVTELEPALRARVEEVARAAYRALELRDYGRIDVRLSSDGIPYVIDVNANCALAPDAGYARAAAAVGLGYDDMIGRILEVALERIHADPSWSERRPVVPRPAAQPHRELHVRGGRLRAGARRARRGRRP